MAEKLPTPKSRGDGMMKRRGMGLLAFLLALLLLIGCQPTDVPELSSVPEESSLTEVSSEKTEDGSEIVSEPSSSPEVSSEPKSEPKSEVKSEPKSEVKSEIKSEPKSEVKSEPKSEPKSEIKSETVSDTEPSAYTPELWRADGKDGRYIYLFGSIHLGDESMYPLPDYVMDAYDSCDTLMVECLIDKEFSDQEIYQMLRPMIYQRGTIRDYVSAETYEAAKKVLQDYGVYDEYLDYYKPVMWESMLSDAIYEAAGITGDFGVDQWFIDRARTENKYIAELESVQSQYACLGGFSDALQEAILESLTEPYYVENNAFAITKFTLPMWKAGTLNENNNFDYTGLEGEDLATQKEYDQAMLIDRNIKMAEKLDLALRTPYTRNFVVVGASHISGEGSLVELLKDYGYTVTRVLPEEDE